MTAAYLGNALLVRHLLQSGARVDAPAFQHCTALHIAVLQDNSDVHM